MTTLAVILTAVAVAPPPNPCAALNAHRNDMAWVLKHCRPLTATQDPRVVQAEAALGRLAGQRSMRARLVVLGGAPGPQAYVNRDHEVVVTTQALDLCARSRGKVRPEAEARANLLFLLSHELAHLHHGDDVAALLAEKDTRYFEFAVKSHERQEVLADGAALVDLARAGADPQLVLKGNLLQTWARADGDPTWADVRHRALRKQADIVGEALPLFQAGFDFLAGGDYERAADLLGTFADRAGYDAREVRSDRAFALLQQAWAVLADCDLEAARRFVLPGVFDPSTLAVRIWRGPEPARACWRTPEFRKPLDEARDLLALVKEQDPDYAPARLNLVAAYLLDEKGSSARAVVQERPATASGEERAAFEAAEALAIYVQAKEDDFPEGCQRAVKRMRESFAARPRDTAVAYNLARMLTEMQDLSAVKAWNDVLALEPPRVLAEGARVELRKLGVHATQAVEAADACAALDPPPAASLPPLGLLQSKGGESLTGGGSKMDVLRPRPGKSTSAGTWRAYADERIGKTRHVVLRVEELSPRVAEADLRRLHGTPEAELPLADGRHVLRFAPCRLSDDKQDLMASAYVIDGDVAVERLTFRPAP